MNPRLILVFVFTLVVSIVAMVFAASIDSITAQNSRVPSAPTGFTARAVFEDGRHIVKLSWDVHPADQGVTGWQFTIWDPETGDDRRYVRLGNRDHTFTAIDDVNVQPATTYVYTVHAINSHGHGDFSRRVTVMTLGNQGEPIVNTDSGSNAPTGLTVENEDIGVRLAWDDPRDPTITGYRIWRRIVRYKHGTEYAYRLGLTVDRGSYGRRGEPLFRQRRVGGEYAVRIRCECDQFNGPTRRNLGRG